MDESTTKDPRAVWKDWDACIQNFSQFASNNDQYTSHCKVIIELVHQLRKEDFLDGVEWGSSLRSLILKFPLEQDILSSVIVGPAIKEAHFRISIESHDTVEVPYSKAVATIKHYQHQLSERLEQYGDAIAEALRKRTQTDYFEGDVLRDVYSQLPPSWLISKAILDAPSGNAAKRLRQLLHNHGHPDNMNINELQNTVEKLVKQEDAMISILWTALEVDIQRRSEAFLQMLEQNEIRS